MRTWTDIVGRQEATFAYCEFMDDPKNAEIRAQCCRDDEEAKRQFAIVGQYYLEGEELPHQPPYDSAFKPIPAKAKFKVFNFEDAEKDNFVTLVLPERGQPMPEVREIWRCTWSPWLALAGE